MPSCLEESPTAGCRTYFRVSMPRRKSLQKDPGVVISFFLILFQEAIGYSHWNQQQLQCACWIIHCAPFSGDSLFLIVKSSSDIFEPRKNPHPTVYRRSFAGFLLQQWFISHRPSWPPCLFALKKSSSHWRQRETQAGVFRFVPLGPSRLLCGSSPEKWMDYPHHHH